MNLRRYRMPACAVATLLTLPGLSSAMVYVDRTAFESAISSLDSASWILTAPPPAPRFPDGGSLATIEANVTFQYDLGGVLLGVIDGTAFGTATNPFDTSSPPSFLGTDDADLFQATRR